MIKSERVLLAGLLLGLIGVSGVRAAETSAFPEVWVTVTSPPIKVLPARASIRTDASDQ